MIILQLQILNLAITAYKVKNYVVIPELKREINFLKKTEKFLKLMGKAVKKLFQSQ